MYRLGLLSTCLFGLTLQGCSTFKTCANVLDDPEYRESTEYKAIAMVVDADTQKPPSRIPEASNTCLFVIDAPNQDPHRRVCRRLELHHNCAGKLPDPGRTGKNRSSSGAFWPNSNKW
jgi:hypothetical protein